MSGTSTAGAEMAGGLHVLFPDGADYAREHLVRRHQNNVPRYSWNDLSEIDRVVQGLVQPVPPSFDRDKSLATLPPEARSNLIDKEPFFIESMRRAVPPLDDEIISRETVTALSEPWGSAPIGALLYIRTTNLGVMAIVDSTKVIDAKDGSLSYGAPPSTAHVELLPAALPAAAASAGMSTLKPVLSLAQMVLFAFGPGGVVAAAGLGMLELIFGGGEEKPDLPKVINDLVVQDFANDHVKADLATIVGYVEWLSRQNARAIAGEMPAKDAKTFAEDLKDLHDYVKDACNPGSNLMHAISDLMNGTYTSDPPFQVLGLPSFLLGALLHLTFEKARLLINTQATTFRAPGVYNIIGAAQDYLDYLDATLETINQAFQERLVVSQLTEGNFTEYAQSMGVPAVTDRRYVYITDAAASKYPEQEVLVPSTGGLSSLYADNIVWYKVCFPKGCSSTGSCDESDRSPGISWRANYAASLNQKLADKYNASEERLNEIAQVREKLATIVKTYQQAAPAHLTAIHPTSGPVGTEVTITGKMLQNTTAVTFGGVAATMRSNTPSKIVTTVPPGAKTGPVTVTTPGGPVDSSETFTVTP